MARPLVGLNAVWIVFVWTTRLRNADGEVAPTVLSLVCLAGAAVLVVAAVRGGGWTRAAVPIVITHGLIWLVRGVQIAGSDHPAAFIAVHLVLAVISILLSVALVRAMRKALPWNTTRAKPIPRI